MDTGGQPGNNNAGKNKPWQGALRRALAEHEGDGIERGQALLAIARTVVVTALTGDKDAIKEIGDRMDGKPVAVVEGPGEGGAHLIDRPPDRPQVTREEWLALHGLATATGSTASGT